MSNREDWGEGGVRPADMRPYTLHDRIRAKVADTRLDVWPSAAIMRATLRHCDHADRILDRHPWHKEAGQVAVCGGCHWLYPCPEVRDLAEAWGVEP